MFRRAGTTVLPLVLLRHRPLGILEQMVRLFLTNFTEVWRRGSRPFARASPGYYACSCRRSRLLRWVRGSVPVETNSSRETHSPAPRTTKNNAKSTKTVENRRLLALLALLQNLSSTLPPPATRSPPSTAATSVALAREKSAASTHTHAHAAAADCGCCCCELLYLVYRKLRKSCNFWWKAVGGTAAVSGTGNRFPGGMGKQRENKVNNRESTT